MSTTENKQLTSQCVPSAMKCYALRVGPGQELKSTLLSFVKDCGLHAAVVMTCCGSVTKATLRFAELGDGGQKIETVTNHYEILSLVGTLSGERGHLHISLGDKDGKVIGGHVMGDLEVFTTAEVIIGELTDVTFSREMDKQTGYPELCVTARK